MQYCCQFVFHNNIIFVLSKRKKKEIIHVPGSLVYNKHYNKEQYNKHYNKEHSSNDILQLWLKRFIEIFYNTLESSWTKACTA